MCGLILAPSRYTDDQIDQALNRMAYRGADNLRGIEGEGRWKIGHIRLAIQDRAYGHQPFHGAGRLTAFVGELFTHDGDEQLYVSRLVQNETLFHQADGFWAIASVSGNQASIFTDHLGIKPLYYWPQYSIVCSEIEPMFALQPQPPLDEIYLSNCIKFGYDYSGRTPYEGIVQLAPGMRLDLSPGVGPSTRIYWHWHLVPNGENLRTKVETAVANRLIGERPVALLLSGGLDSSIIYHILRYRGADVTAFSVENGESEFLPDDVKILDLPPVAVNEALGVLKAPLDLGSMVPQVQLARAVAQAGFNVCLSGDGADEVFGGYKRSQIYDSQRSDVFCELPYYHLPRLDRVMMASTIELRSPFLAPQVIAHGLRLPWEVRHQKDALKHAFRGFVPNRIIDRPKHPLKTPEVIRGGLEYRQKLVNQFRQIIRGER